MSTISGRYSCDDYREAMLLSGLRRRLQDPKLSEAERGELRRRIESLEKRMGLN